MKKLCLPPYILKSPTIERSYVVVISHFIVLRLHKSKNDCNQKSFKLQMCACGAWIAAGCSCRIYRVKLSNYKLLSIAPPQCCKRENSIEKSHFLLTPLSKTVYFELPLDVTAMCAYNNFHEFWMNIFETNSYLISVLMMTQRRQKG